MAYNNEGTVYIYSDNIIKLNSIDTTDTTNMEDMFSECTNLEKIFVSNTWKIGFSTKKTDMFGSCKAGGVTVIS